ncbi:MAG: class I lanthipeptide [Crocinitomix sp.]|nr:class I lanthipeptide [Crocinitomix sp.]
MKTNKIKVDLSLNKETVTKLSDNNKLHVGIPGTLTSWINQEVLHAGNCRIREARSWGRGDHAFAEVFTGAHSNDC